MHGSTQVKNLEKNIPKVSSKYLQGVLNVYRKIGSGIALWQPVACGFARASLRPLLDDGGLARGGQAQHEDARPRLQELRRPAQLIQQALALRA